MDDPFRSPLEGLRSHARRLRTELADLSAKSRRGDEVSSLLARRTRLGARKERYARFAKSFQSLPGVRVLAILTPAFFLYVGIGLIPVRTALSCFALSIASGLALEWRRKAVPREAKELDAIDERLKVLRSRTHDEESPPPQFAEGSESETIDEVRKEIDELESKVVAAREAVQWGKK